jgi:hypothetical protein
MQEDSRGVGDVELAVDRVQAKPKRCPVVKEGLLQPRLEDAGTVDRCLEVIDAHQAADIVEIDPAASVADQLQKGGTACPAEEFLAVELQDEVGMAHVGPAVLQATGVVAQVVGRVEEVDLNPRVVEPLAGAAPVAGERRLLPVRRVVGGVRFVGGRQSGQRLPEKT